MMITAHQARGDVSYGSRIKKELAKIGFAGMLALSACKPAETPQAPVSPASSCMAATYDYGLRDDFDRLNSDFDRLRLNMISEDSVRVEAERLSAYINARTIDVGGKRLSLICSTKPLQVLMAEMRQSAPGGVAPADFSLEEVYHGRTLVTRDMMDSGAVKPAELPRDGVERIAKNGKCLFDIEADVKRKAKVSYVRENGSETGRLEFHAVLDPAPPKESTYGVRTVDLSAFRGFVEKTTGQPVSNFMIVLDKPGDERVIHFVPLDNFGNPIKYNGGVIVTGFSFSEAVNAISGVSASSGWGILYDK